MEEPPYLKSYTQHIGQFYHERKIFSTGIEDVEKLNHNPQFEFSTESILAVYISLKK